MTPPTPPAPDLAAVRAWLEAMGPGDDLDAFENRATMTARTARWLLAQADRSAELERDVRVLLDESRWSVEGWHFWRNRETAKQAILRLDAAMQGKGR